jgi:hypothetical protein
MLKTNTICSILAGVMTLGLVGCETAPGTREQQGAVIGGATGAAVGAAVGGSEHRILGALIGGALGAGGGYVIAANTGAVESEDRQAAVQAARRAQQNPATAEQAMAATTADINNDGFVTLDEVVAMSDAGFSEQEMIRRMEATNQVFELTNEQQNYLVQQGVDQQVVNQMNDLNRDLLYGSPGQRQDVIGRDPNTF